MATICGTVWGMGGGLRNGICLLLLLICFYILVEVWVFRDMLGGRWEAEILFVVRGQHLHGALHRLCVCAHAIQRTHPAGIMTLLCLSCSANKMTIVHSVTSQHRTWTTHDTNDQRSKRQRYETIDTNVSPFRPNTKQHGMPTRNMI